MPEFTCPIEGFETFVVDVPAVFTVRHYDQFVRGMAAAQAAKKFTDESPVNVARFYGCRAVCPGADAPAGEVEDWPLAVFVWYLETVYYQRLDKALNPPKN
jgi:hypothetical protein